MWPSLSTSTSEYPVLGFNVNSLNHHHPSRTHLSGINNDVFYLSSVVTLERSCESSWELKRRGGEKYLSGDRSTNNLKTQ